MKHGTHCTLVIRIGIMMMPVWLAINWATLDLVSCMPSYAIERYNYVALVTCLVDAFFI